MFQAAARINRAFTLPTAFFAATPTPSPLPLGPAARHERTPKFFIFSFYFEADKYGRNAKTATTKKVDRN